MGGLFGGGAPKLPPPTRMPDQADPSVLEAERKKREELAQRSGRQSTILSDALGSKLGAG